MTGPARPGELVAAVDCGTNSIRLYVAQVAADGSLVELDRRLHLTRLGQGVDATGRFDPEALARTLAGLSDFAAEFDALGVGRVRVVATSAARDAANREEFFRGVHERFGVPAEIISGQEEAWLSYLGAVVALGRLPEPVMVMDIGGGSTELVVGSGRRVEAAVSLDMGSVRLRERFLATDPPTDAEIRAAAAYIDTLLDGSAIEFGSVRSWVGVGGTATSLSALVHGLQVYDRAIVHGSTVALGDLEALTARLLAMPVPQVTALPTMEPGRADVICAGALICRQVGRRVVREMLVSEADILDGIALGLAGGNHAGAP